MLAARLSDALSVIPCCNSLLFGIDLTFIRKGIDIRSLCRKLTTSVPGADPKNKKEIVVSGDVMTTEPQTCSLAVIRGTPANISGLAPRLAGWGPLGIFAAPSGGPFANVSGVP